MTLNLVVHPPTKAAHAANLIREAILTGEYVPGQRLLLRELQVALRLSVTPIREGLRLLQNEGLVTEDPHRGTFVAAYDLSDAREIYALRAELEEKAIKLATARVTPEDIERLRALAGRMEMHMHKGRWTEGRQANREFHMACYALSGWPHLAELIEQMWRKFPWGTMRSADWRWEQACAEHDHIVDAMERGDAETAGREMRHHIEVALTELIERTERGDDQLPWVRKAADAVEALPGAGSDSA